MTHVQISKRAGLPIAAIALAFALAGLLVMLHEPQPAEATIFAVTKTNDTLDNVCDADCSLRDAIVAANANGGPDIINLSDGMTYNLSIGGSDDASAMGDLDITDDVTINGGSLGTTTIDAGDIDNVLSVLSGTATVSAVILQNGTAAYGGGVYVAMGATLNLTNATVQENTAFGFAGGINNTGTLNLTNSTVWMNSTANQTGGILNNFGTMTLTNTTVSGNMSGFGPGGIYNFNGATLNIYTSTIADNTSGSVGGIENGSGTVNLKNTILSDNTGNNYPECYGDFNSLGNNLIQNQLEGCNVTGETATNITGMSASLGPIAYNGGPTMTQALMVDSPAIDYGSSDCPPPGIDQRGNARPQGNRCDIGAYESSFSGPTPPPTPSPTPTPSPSPTPTGSPTPTPTADPTVTPTETATPTATPPETPSPTPPGTPTPTATPAPTPTGGTKRLQGDVDCDGDVDTVDALFVLRDVAELPVNQPKGCPEIGSAGSIFGDVDCDGDVDAVDALFILRDVAALPVNVPKGCTPIGEPL